MPVDRATFDADLAAEDAAQTAQQQLVTTYIADVTAFIGLQPVLDLAAEDATVQAGLAAVNTSGAAVAAGIAALPPPPPKPGP
jgi:D-arabinose 1-dehydrogenase-like Zn-dependent alcohol dehydrogenase